MDDAIVEELDLSRASLILGQRYGLQCRLSGKDKKKFRHVWAWVERNDGIVTKEIYPHVVSLPVPNDGTASGKSSETKAHHESYAKLLAEALGVDQGDLSAIHDGVYSRNCLQLVLVVHQIHRQVDFDYPHWLPEILNFADSLLQQLQREGLGDPCKKLRPRYDAKLSQLLGNDATKHVAQRILALI